MNRAKLSLRPAQMGDDEFLFQLFVERNTARFAPLGWSDTQLRSMLQMQYRARVAGYAQQFANLERFVICIADQQPIGEVLLYRTNQEMRIVDICISDEYREQGIGTQVLSELQREAATTGSAITLSVDHENPARKLYERLGFFETGCNALQAEMRWQFAETV
jgi:ribosomal protein S18 acetylase RimI-like enzyme